MSTGRVSSGVAPTVASAPKTGGTMSVETYELADACEVGDLRLAKHLLEEGQDYDIKYGYVNKHTGDLIYEEPLNIKCMVEEPDIKLRDPKCPKGGESLKSGYTTYADMYTYGQGGDPGHFVVGLEVFAKFPLHKLDHHGNPSPPGTNMQEITLNRRVWYKEQITTVKELYAATNEAVLADGTVVPTAQLKADEYFPGIIIKIHKADVNEQGYGLRTAIHVAAWKGYPELVKLLLYHGSKVNPKDKAGKTPLDYAMIELDKDKRSSGHQEVVDIFNKVKTEEGRTEVLSAITADQKRLKLERKLEVMSKEIGAMESVLAVYKDKISKGFFKRLARKQQRADKSNFKGNKRAIKSMAKQMEKILVLQPQLALEQAMMELTENPEETQAAFEALDKDGSGELDRDEFAAFLVANLGKKLDNEEIDRLVAAADTDGNGQISYEEFARVPRGLAQVKESDFAVGVPTVGPQAEYETKTILRTRIAQELISVKGRSKAEYKAWWAKLRAADDALEIDDRMALLAEFKFMKQTAKTMFNERITEEELEAIREEKAKKKKWANPTEVKAAD